MVGILSRFLLGPGLFSGAFAVSFRECLYFLFLRGFCLGKNCKRMKKRKEKHKAFLTDLVDDAGFVFLFTCFFFERWESQAETYERAFGELVASKFILLTGGDSIIPMTL